MLRLRAKAIDEIFSSLCDPYVDFNPDFVHPALMDAYDEGNKHGMIIGTLFATVCFIGYEFVKAKKQKDKESE